MRAVLALAVLLVGGLATGTGTMPSPKFQEVSPNVAIAIAITFAPDNQAVSQPVNLQTKSTCECAATGSCSCATCACPGGLPRLVFDGQKWQFAPEGGAVAVPARSGPVCGPNGCKPAATATTCGPNGCVPVAVGGAASLASATPGTVGSIPVGLTPSSRHFVTSCGANSCSTRPATQAEIDTGLATALPAGQHLEKRWQNSTWVAVLDRADGLNVLELVSTDGIPIGANMHGGQPIGMVPGTQYLATMPVTADNHERLKALEVSGARQSVSWDLASPANQPSCPGGVCVRQAAPAGAPIVLAMALPEASPACSTCPLGAVIPTVHSSSPVVVQSAPVTTFAPTNYAPMPAMYSQDYEGRRFFERRPVRSFLHRFTGRGCCR